MLRAGIATHNSTATENVSILDTSLVDSAPACEDNRPAAPTYCQTSAPRRKLAPVFRLAAIRNTTGIGANAFGRTRCPR
jgi:hypothetical protein